SRAAIGGGSHYYSLRSIDERRSRVETGGGNRAGVGRVERPSHCRGSDTGQRGRELLGLAGREVCGRWRQEEDPGRVQINGGCLEQIRVGLVGSGQSDALWGRNVGRGGV